MRNNICVKKIYVILIFALLYMPIFVFAGIKEPLTLPHDKIEYERKLKFSFQNYKTKKFQQQYESWYNNSYFSFNFFMKLKNSIYYLFNFGYFVYPQGVLDYRNIIVYGDNLFAKRAYLGHGVDSEKFSNENELDKPILKLAYIQNNLEKIGKKFIVIIPPNIIFMNSNNTYKYIKYFDDKNRNNIYKMYFQHFDKYKINLLNPENILQKSLNEGISPFLKTNTHWNSWGAGLTMIETFKHLKQKYNADWELPQIKEIKYSTSIISGAFISETQKLIPSFIEIAKPEKEPYIVYAQTKTNDLYISIIGDSFVRDFYNQMINSKFAPKEQIFEYGNVWNAIKDFRKVKPTSSMLDVKTIVSKSDIIIFLFTEPIIGENTMVSNELYVEAFYNYFSTNRDIIK